jgi:hypothetical protein
MFTKILTGCAATLCIYMIGIEAEAQTPLQQVQLDHVVLGCVRPDAIMALKNPYDPRRRFPNAVYNIMRTGGCVTLNEGTMITPGPTQGFLNQVSYPGVGGVPGQVFIVTSDLGPSPEKVRARAIAAEQARQAQAETDRIAAETKKAEAERRLSAARAATARAESDAKEAEERRERDEQFQQAQLREEQAEKAENNPDNVCKTPERAGAIIEGTNSIKEDTYPPFKVVDLEHVTTLAFDPASETIECHATFVLSTGIKLQGTFKVRKNIAGTLLTEFDPD